MIPGATASCEDTHAILKVHGYSILRGDRTEVTGEETNRHKLKDGKKETQRRQRD